MALSPSLSDGMSTPKKDHDRSRLPGGGEAGTAKCISRRCTGNNTIRTVWDPVTRKSHKTVSAGRMGLKGARRGSPYAAEMVGREIGNVLRASAAAATATGTQPTKDVVEAYKAKPRVVVVLFAGQSAAVGSGLRGLRSALGETGRITSLVDVTPIPHNGCRARKPRRV
jgi:small subunit ribosomal protein S11